MEKDKNTYQYSGRKKKCMISLPFHFKGSRRVMKSYFDQNLSSKEPQKFMNLTEILYLKILQGN